MDQAVINTMEVLETRPINELVTECTIKVCWVGDDSNANFTQISREVGKEIAATLPGAPVAGFFDKETGDFAEHSRKITIQEGEVIFEDITKPYGFVSPVDQPWYQDFDEEGVTRTYLMCKAYLWTRQYEEASLALNKGQSMELNERTMSGYYEGNVFVFTNVTLDKLCILGDSYAPCFAGAKIMSTYAKQYTNLAEQLEKIIGRRYYVLNDSLVEKKEKVSLSYAIELGWHLEDSIYEQLAARGAESYGIEGIFSDGSAIFVILNNRATQEKVRVDLTINADQTIELATEMQAVSMEWVPKTIIDEAPVPSLSNEATVVADLTPQLNVSASYTEAGEVEEVTVEVEEAAEVIEEAVEQTEVIEGEIDAAENNEPAAEEAATDFAAEGNVSAGGVTDELPTAEPVVVETVPAQPPIDYVVEYDRLLAENAEFTEKVNEYTEKIAFLENEIANKDSIIAAYHIAEAESLNAQKEEVVSSYKELLTDEEIAPVLEKIGDYSLEEVDSKLALVYAKKAKSTKPAAQFQVSVSSVVPEELDIPDFIRQAVEYDKEREIVL